MVLDVNRREIQVGDKIVDLSDGWQTAEPCEVFVDGEELAINVDGTTIYLSEIETEVTCLIVD